MGRSIDFLEDSFFEVGSTAASVNKMDEYPVERKTIPHEEEDRTFDYVDLKLYRNPMNISVELTFSPLQDDFEEHIIRFIKKLRASGLTILENPLSTQVYGDYDAVMEVLNEEIKTAFEMMDKGLLYLKIVKSDRSEYQADF